MIVRLTDIGRLSGVSSPLLPLIYCDYYSCVNETDGVYVQTVDDEDTLLFSLRNGAVNLVCLSEKWDKDEFLSLTNFTHTRYVTADFKWDYSAEAYFLMEYCAEKPVSKKVTSITAQSTLNEYRNIHSLLSDEGDDFESWYVAFSSKINNGQALAVYTDDFRSCAVCTAIFDGVGVVAGVYTNTEHRGKGYGRSAVLGLLGAMNKANVRKAVLWCEDKNISFYEKSGFTRKGEIYYSEVK